MLDSPILQVILGLIFIFSLFSVIVTQVNTSIANLFHLRAKSLKNGIYGLLTDAETRARFMAHPLIKLIPDLVQPEQKISAQAANDIVEQSTTGILWIEPDLFSETLIDILAAYANDRLFRTLYEVAGRLLSGTEEAQITESIRRFQNGGLGLVDLQNAINQLPDAAIRQQILAQLEQMTAMRRELQANNEQSKLIPLLAGVQEIADPGMRKALETLLASASSVDEARMKLESWFNARMWHVTEFYKRNMMRISYIVGLVLVILLNVDTLQIARTLWDDPALRQTVALAADVAVSSGALQRQIENSEAALNDTLSQMAQPDATAEPDTAPASAPSTPAITGDLVSFDSAFNDLLSLRIPVGWESTPVEGGCPNPDRLTGICADGRNIWLAAPANNANWLGWIVSKLIGWAITVLAIAQGAPFWFDLLNRIARGSRSS